MPYNAVQEVQSGRLGYISFDNNMGCLPFDKVVLDKAHAESGRKPIESMKEKSIALFKASGLRVLKLIQLAQDPLAGTLLASAACVMV